MQKQLYMKKYIGAVDKQLSDLHKKSKTYLSGTYNKVRVMPGVYKLQKKGTRDTTKYLVGKKIHYKKTAGDRKRKNLKQKWER